MDIDGDTFTVGEFITASVVTILSVILIITLN